ncbi:MAG: Ig-like domain-containing protein [Gammaproteobacteria bacterium]
MTATSGRLLLIFCAWVFLSGKTVIRCSSGDDDDNLLPPPSGNRPPVAADGFYQVSSAGTLVGFMRATDPDGDRLSYRVISGPSLGSLQDIDSGSGRFTYIPGTVGTDSFSFRANDGGRDSNTAVITITVVQASAVQANVTGAGQASTDDNAKHTVSPPLAALAMDPLDPESLLIAWAPPANRIDRIGPQGTALTASADARSRLEQAQGLVRFASGQPKPESPPGLAVDLTLGGALPTGYVLARVEDRFGIRGHMLVSAVTNRTRIWHSQDAGTSWRQVGPDLPGPANAANLFQHPELPLRWVLALEIGGVWRVLGSDDAGASWGSLADIPGSGLRIVGCWQDSTCLVDRDGTHLWRLRHETPSR